MSQPSPLKADSGSRSDSAQGKQLFSDSELASRTGTAATETGAAGNGGSTQGLLGSIAASAKTMASAFDPREAHMLRQYHTIGPSGGDAPIGGSSGSKASTSAASRTFQHTTHALETLGSTSTNIVSGGTMGSGFRGASTMSEQQTAAGGSMDWDNFLSSSEPTLQEEQPYRPPSMASFGFSTLDRSEQPVIARTPQVHESRLPQQQWQPQPRQAEPQVLEPVYQAHLSQPMNLTPANHAAFLEYLKSTANLSSNTAQSSSSSSSIMSHGPISAQTQQQPEQQQQSYPTQHHQHHQNQHPQQPAPQQHQYAFSNPTPVYSADIHRQQHLDGGDILAFLNSTSYSDFVDQIESEGLSKHQQDRREFVYSESILGGPQTRSLFSTLQLIQHLPSERQDVVEYLLQQGTYTEDVWSRPFGHDVEKEEGASMAATRAEQDRFLEQQQQQQQLEQQWASTCAERDEGKGDDATTEEMERVLKQIVDDAKTEVKSGQTDGRALNRLMMVRSHIKMGTKL